MLLRRRGQGGTEADGAKLKEVIRAGGTDGAALVVVFFPPLGG